MVELYTDDTGGVQLEDLVFPGTSIPVTETETETSQQADDAEQFWPPKCRCEILCRKFLHPK